MPEHDLQPPKFSRRAYSIMLGDFTVLKTVIMVGVKLIHELVHPIFGLGKLFSVML
jgi:hypothetical protein